MFDMNSSMVGSALKDMLDSTSKLGIHFFNFTSIPTEAEFRAWSDIFAVYDGYPTISIPALKTHCSDKGGTHLKTLNNLTVLGKVAIPSELVVSIDYSDIDFLPEKGGVPNFFVANFHAGTNSLTSSNNLDFLGTVGGLGSGKDLELPSELFVIGNSYKVKSLNFNFNHSLI